MRFSRFGRFAWFAWFGRVFPRVLLGGLTGAGTLAAESGVLEAEALARSGRLTVVGRTVATADGARVMAYPGVELRFSYAGPAPVLHLHARSATCYFNLSVNGWAPAVLHLAAGDNTIVLPSGPAPATGWTVSLVRRTEAWQGLVEFRGLELTDPASRLLPPPPARDRRVLVIGDSITTGHFVEQLPGHPDPSPRTNNAERTWGWILARHHLDAEVAIVAYGGRGLTRTWDGRTEPSTGPQFFERALPDDPAAIWDHDAYRPDLVVIMLGQNDFNLGLPDRTHFLATYRAFLQRLHAVHPAAAVILGGSPMHGTAPGSEDASKRDTLYAWLDAIAATARTEDGLTSIAVVRVSHQPGTALNAHPVVFQMEKIAAEIAPVARRLTGW